MQSNSRKVAKNAIYLYIRTGVSLIVQFIAIRFLLKNLGVEGYGLYGLIGSIVGIVESLKGLLSGSIQRFINIEIGNKNEKNIHEIFNVGLRIHTILAFCLIGGIIVSGLIAIPYLKIPIAYINQAFYVLIISAITMGISIIGSPFDAIITAYERFNLYALNSIIASILKLAIALVLVFFPYYTVTIYAFLLLCVTATSNLINIIYCNYHFKEHIKLQKVTNKHYYKTLTTFAGLKSLGTIGMTLQSSGLNFILNIFGGLIVNTARTITYQIMTAVNTLTWNINIGFTPRCLTLWGGKEYDEFYKLLGLETKLCFSINSILGCIIATFSSSILKIWLGEIPQYASEFIQIIFFYSVLKSLQDIFDLVFSAHGIVKAYQLSVFLINLLSIGGMYAILTLGLPLYSAFWVLAFSELIIIITCSILTKIQFNFDIKKFFCKILSHLILAGMLQISIFLLFHKYLVNINSFLQLILYIIPFSILLTILTIVIVFNKREILTLLRIIKNIRYGKKQY